MSKTFCIAVITFLLLCAFTTGLLLYNKRAAESHVDDMPLLSQVQAALFNYYIAHDRHMAEPDNGTYSFADFTGEGLLSEDDKAAAVAKGWQMYSCDALSGSYVFDKAGENICLEMTAPAEIICTIEKEMDDGNLDTGIGRKKSTAGDMKMDDCANLPDIKIPYIYHLF